MILVVTSIELRSIFKFFPLSWYAFKIINQLKGENYISFKKQGIGKTHYTITTWENIETMKAFASSGAHLNAMKKSKSIAKTIKVYTANIEEEPTWEKAIELLNNQGKTINY